MLLGFAFCISVLICVCDGCECFSGVFICNSFGFLLFGLGLRFAGEGGLFWLLV